MIRIFGTKIYISFFTLILFFIMLFSPDRIFFLIMLICAAFHELSHIIAMTHLGCPITRLNIYPFGAELACSTYNISYKGEILVALSGPLMSLAMAVISTILYCFFGGIYLLCAAISNVVYFAVNALPVKSLDGARALMAFLLMKLDFTRAIRIYTAICTAGFGLLCLFALYTLFITGYNLSLIFICAYLFLSCYAKEKVT